MKRMDDMENEIKTIKKTLNAVLAMSSVSLFLTIMKIILILPDYEPTAPSNNNSVQIGDVKTKPQRDHLTTEEVAEREGVTARTVISWIEQNRIYPAPVKSDRAWIISADYRILPQLTANQQ